MTFILLILNDSHPNNLKINNETLKKSYVPHMTNNLSEIMTHKNWDIYMSTLIMCYLRKPQMLNGICRRTQFNDDTFSASSNGHKITRCIWWTAVVMSNDRSNHFPFNKQSCYVLRSVSLKHGMCCAETLVHAKCCQHIFKGLLSCNRRKRSRALINVLIACPTSQVSESDTLTNVDT